MERLWAPWRMEWIGGAGGADGDRCILCAIADDAHPQASHIVERTATTFTVLNRFPYASGHLMVVPRRHTAHVTGLTPAEAAELMWGAQRAVSALEASLLPDGFNLGINHGRGAGAGIDEHVHLHVVPRWSGDTNFMPVLADVRVMPEALDRTAEKVRAGYSERSNPTPSESGPL